VVDHYTEDTEGVKAAFGRATLGEWPLARDVTYLNHGTVGVTPRRVLEAQQRLREEADRAPAQTILRRQSGLVGARADGAPSETRAAAAVVAAFVGSRSEDLVFVDNVTTGMSAVLRSQPFSAGDEVLVTDHAYGAVANALHAVVGAARGVVRRVAMPYPDYSPEALVEAVGAALSPRTRLAVFDHITAQSALVLPLVELVSLCRGHNVKVLIDGAHAPGVLPLRLGELGAHFYTANLHKWACAPRSCGFLWADPSEQADLHSPVVSWGFGQGFTAEFDWVGTKDLSAWLAAPVAIDYLRSRGVADAWEYNHALACDAGRYLSERWDGLLPAMARDTGFMVTVAAPQACGADEVAATALRDRLLMTHAIEVQVHSGYGRVWVRVSAQTYNEWADIARLADAVLMESRQ
jgi:isopenicillin-N epimerase